jgi:hypothetical protein
LQTKMLHIIPSVCFGEAATQRSDIWPTAALGRPYHQATPYRLDFAKVAICALLTLVHGAARATAQAGR